MPENAVNVLNKVRSRYFVLICHQASSNENYTCVGVIQSPGVVWASIPCSLAERSHRYHAYRCLVVHFVLITKIINAR